MNDDRDTCRAETDLLKSVKAAHAILTAVFESSANVVIFALDRAYRYLAFNRSHQQTMRDIWGVDIAVGQKMLDLIKNPEDRRKAQHNFDRALAGESFKIEEQYGDETKARRYFEDNYNPIRDEKGDVIGLTLFLTDITERKAAEADRDRLILELQEALGRVKMLSGLLPVCAQCKKIRNDEGVWERIETYISKHSDAHFSHGLCPECARRLYPEFVKGK